MTIRSMDTCPCGQVASWTTFFTDESHCEQLHTDNSLRWQSPHGRLAPWTTGPINSSPHGQIAHGQLALWITRLMATRPMDNSPITRPMDILHGQLASWTIRPIDNSPQGQVHPMDCSIIQFLYKEKCRIQLNWTKPDPIYPKLTLSSITLRNVWMTRIIWWGETLR